jgi:uncharacterized integral membrane protein
LHEGNPGVSHTRAETRFWTLGRIIGVLLGALVIVLAALNFQPVEVSFVVFRVNMPLFFLIVIVLAIGFVAGGWLLRTRSR